MSDHQRLSQENFDLSDDDISPEHLDSQVQRAQEQIIALKRQQQEIERQKRELEELSRRQEQLQTGQADMIEKLTRAQVIIEREKEESLRRAEMLQNTFEKFASHLDYLEHLDLKGFEGHDLTRELTRALSALDDARAEYSRAIPRISLHDNASGDTAAEFGYSNDLSGSQDFSRWLKMGIAFTLPVVLIGLLIFFALIFSGGHR